MNRTKIKNYAPQARRDFLQAVTDRAAFYGLTADRIEPVTVQGDVAIIGGRAFPREIGAKRKALQERVERDGYGPTMEALAYTWFNRLVAIRYMELHGYLDHGYRVLSAATDSHGSNTDPTNPPNFPHPRSVRVPSVADIPEILKHAEHVELPDLNRGRVIELKLNGSKEAELYRMLLVAQCNALHSAMPFLFERIGDETELVLPENLLHSDSIVRKLVSGIDEEDWREVEVIGWLYEAYVSERYEAVIGSVVASADIPAATQRFTPKWIVRYLVQNTLGRQWLATYPQSPLKGQMKYYIEPAEQTPEVLEQLRAITPTSLNPEEITFLDPACGSAHILVEAYDLFKAIYQERGYRAKDIPRLILGKNLFGLEIDDRAAQLAAFALMMMARADDRSIFDQGIQPQVRSLIQTDGMDAEDIAAALNVTASKETPPPGRLFETEDDLFTRSTPTATRSPYISLTDVKAVVDLFEHAKTFGSLIQVPEKLASRLPQIEASCRNVAQKTDEIASRTAAKFLPFVEQARILADQYDCVVANPPYMGSKYYNSPLKMFVNKQYKDAKADLCVVFIERAFYLAKPTGLVGEITMQSWMFLSSFEDFRVRLLRDRTMRCMAHLGPHAFPNIGGQVVQVVAFVASQQIAFNYCGSYKRLTEGASNAKEERFTSVNNYTASNSIFRGIPGSPWAYWVSQGLVDDFRSGTSLAMLADVRQGLSTADDARFVRLWHEVDFAKSNLTEIGGDLVHGHTAKWFALAKGGTARRWYGNLEYVINWQDNGKELSEFLSADGTPRAYLRGKNYYFREGITWSRIGVVAPSFRMLPSNCIFSDVAPTVFSHNNASLDIIAFLNSCIVPRFLEVLSPTTHFEIGQLKALPVRQGTLGEKAVTNQLIQLSMVDWNSFETSWDFSSLPVIRHEAQTLRTSQEVADDESLDLFHQMKELEEENNRLFIEAYGLQDELSPEVPDDQITLYRPNRDEDIKRLISYTVGCTMGRYSLDTPGLIYAHGGNVGFNPGQYTTFPADPDGIVPVMEADWFADDAANRLVEFLGVAWPREGLDENLKFVADALGPNKGEPPRDTIRRYLATGFFKHHLQTYKRRPIYWLFSSGKGRAFQCLVYLHRYHDGTLARMRTEYVIPLQGKIVARIEKLEDDKAKATSTSHRNKLQKEQDNLKKQQAELLDFEEKLRHAADQRISLDLDDGVKVNYGKFGDLLAEVKAVTGGKDEEG